MLFNITYTDKDDIAEINKMVGKSLRFIPALKLKGTGSGRMIIEDVSERFKNILTKVSDLNYGNIELRPRGIIIYITKQLEQFCWVIPYYKLTVFNGNYFSIHSDNNFIRFRKDVKYRENKKFIDKMMHLKVLQTQNHFL